MKAAEYRALVARGMDEDSELLPAVLDRLRRYRWTLAFHDYDPVRNRAGLPDVLAIRGAVLLVVELKSHTGRLRPAQRLWLAGFEAVAAASGGAVRVHVWRPSDLLDGTIDAALR